MTIIRTLSLAVALGISLTSCSGGGDKTVGSGAGLDVNGNPIVNILGVTWTAPSQREDGSSLSLSEIKSYRIYYGREAGDYQNQLDITDASAVTGQVEGIESGTYYVVITTLDTDGRESLYSQELVVTL